MEIYPKISIVRNHFYFSIILSSIVLFHLPQLNVPFIETTTRPIFHVLMVPFIAYIVLYNKFFLHEDIKIKWLVLFFVFIYYSALGVIYCGDIYRVVRYLVSFLFVFLFYILGFNLFFLRERTFLKISLVPIVCISIIGLIQSLGMLFNDQLIDVVNKIREFILSQVLDRKRLTLLFSEPSFLSSYLLFLHFLSNRYSKYKFRFGIFLKFLVLLFAVLSKSIYVYIVFSTLYLAKILQVRFIKKRIIYTAISFGIISLFIAFELNRFISLLYMEDMSAFIRFLYVKALLNMAIDSYLLGLGIGSFGYYFPIFLNNEYIIPSELLPYLYGERLAVPFSLFFQFLGETGILGALAFLWLIFSGFRKSYYKHYYIAAFVCTLSALPWGLPYFWFLIGYIHYNNLMGGR